MTKVTIIIHEGHGGPRGRGRHQRPFGRQTGHGPRRFRHGERGEHSCGPRHEGEREFGRRGWHKGEHAERSTGHHGERGFGRHGEHQPWSEQERQAAREVRHEVRRLMRAAEEAGLSPEHVARAVRRETRRQFD